MLRRSVLSAAQLEITSCAYTGDESFGSPLHGLLGGESGADNSAGHVSALDVGDGSLSVVGGAVITSLAQLVGDLLHFTRLPLARRFGLRGLGGLWVATTRGAHLIWAALVLT